MNSPSGFFFQVSRLQPETIDALRALGAKELPDPTCVPADAGMARFVFAPLGFYNSAEFLDPYTRLETVVSNTTGISHIDEEYCRRRGIRVVSLADFPRSLSRITPTAELAVGLTLAVTRNIMGAHADACKGLWDRHAWVAPRMLSRSTVCVVGIGRLGMLYSAALEAMGATVLKWDPKLGGTTRQLLEMCGSSQIISIHAGGLPPDRPCIGYEQLSALGPEGCVINTARAEYLDYDALISMLEGRQLAGAGLDVVPGERGHSIQDSTYLLRLAALAGKNPRVILTPHIGGSTVDARQETEMMIVDYLRKWIVNGHTEAVFGKDTNE